LVYISGMGNFAIYGGSVSLDLPAQWDDHSVYTFVAPEQSMSAGLPTMAKQQGFRPNVVVTREAKGKYERLDAYAKDQLSASSKALPQLKVVSEEAGMTGGIASISRVFTFVVPNQNATVQQLQIFAMHGPWVYTVTFSTLPQFYAEHKKLFDQVTAKMSFN
jgi:hypothetical protein